MVLPRNLDKFLGRRLTALFNAELAHRGMDGSKAALVRDAIAFYLSVPIKDRVRDPRNQPRRGRKRRMDLMRGGEEQVVLRIDGDAFKQDDSGEATS